MSEKNPQYSKEPILDGIEHLGHWLHVGETDTIGTAERIIHDGIVVAAEMKAQFPTLAADSGAVALDITKCPAIGAAIANLATTGGPINLAGDAAFMAALIVDAVPLCQAFIDGGKLLNTLNQDVKTDVQSLE
jgi:hypothetical protein